MILLHLLLLRIHVFFYFLVPAQSFSEDRTIPRELSPVVPVAPPCPVAPPLPPPPPPPPVPSVKHSTPECVSKEEKQVSSSGICKKFDLVFWMTFGKNFVESKLLLSVLRFVFKKMKIQKYQSHILQISKCCTDVSRSNLSPGVTKDISTVLYNISYTRLHVFQTLRIVM